MNRTLAVKIYYHLLNECKFKRGDKFHLTKQIVNSKDLIDTLNINIVQCKPKDLYILYLTNSYCGNYFKFKTLEEFKIWYNCLDIKLEYETPPKTYTSAIYIAPYGYFYQ